jgi:hypothetical protein
VVTPEPDAAEPPPASAAPANSLLTCKQCGEADNLTGMYGQYGYYVKCGSCSTNTSMKQGVGERRQRIVSHCPLVLRQLW